MIVYACDHSLPQLLKKIEDKNESQNDLDKNPRSKVYICLRNHSYGVRRSKRVRIAETSGEQPSIHTNASMTDLNGEFKRDYLWQPSTIIVAVIVICVSSCCFFFSLLNMRRIVVVLIFIMARRHHRQLDQQERSLQRNSFGNYNEYQHMSDLQTNRPTERAISSSDI